MILPDEPSEISSWLLISDWIQPELAEYLLGYCLIWSCMNLPQDVSLGFIEGLCLPWGSWPDASKEARTVRFWLMLLRTCASRVFL